MTQSGRYFTPDYAERVVLRDGTAVQLRLVTPDDKQLLADGFQRLSPESRYARFLGPKLTLSDDELQYLCDIDQENHFAIGAVREDGDGDGGPVGLGIARFIRLPDPPNTAEAAIAVADEMHGHGLGKLLFMRLCAAAAERGIETFRCEVLGSNYGMKHLIEAISPQHTVEVGGGIMSIDFAVPSIPPTEPATGPSPEHPMYKLFRAAAENAVEWTEAVRKLWRP